MCSCILKALMIVYAWTVRWVFIDQTFKSVFLFVIFCNFKIVCNFVNNYQLIFLLIKHIYIIFI